MRPIATKYGKVVTYLEGLAPINSQNPLNIWSLGVTWEIKNISIIATPMVTRLIRVVTNHEELPPVYLCDPSVKWLCEVTWQVKYISPQVLIYLERPSLLKSNDTLIAWPHVGQFEKFISPLLQHWWSLDLARCLVTGRGLARKRLSGHRLLVKCFMKIIFCDLVIK